MGVKPIDEEMAEKGFRRALGDPAFELSADDPGMCNGLGGAEVAVS